MSIIKDWLVDYIYLLKGTALMYYHRNPPKHYLGVVKENKAPIILLQGMTLRWASLKQFGDSISLLGHPVYIVPKIGNNMLSIEKTANFTREIVDEHNLKNVIIVAHSKGGLVGKYMLVYKNRDQRIRGVIAVATPFSGSKLSTLPFTAFKELKTDSKIIHDLKSEKSVNKKIISLMPEFDNHIWAKEGCFLDGAKNIPVPVKGHHKVLFSKEVKERILDSIEALSK